MNIWTIEKWKNNLDDENRRTGLYFRYDSNVNPEFRDACKRFAKWVRSEFHFPLRVPVYVKEQTYIKAKDGECVVGVFFEPYEYSVEPYIRIAAGDYDDLKNEIGKDNAIAAILSSIAHEITHYFQWINNLQLTDIGRERQATRYSHLIIDMYSKTCDHP